LLLDPSVASGWNLAGVAGGTAFTTANGRLSLGTSTGSWLHGEANDITLTATAQRANTPDGPFAVDFGIAPQDSDGVRMGSFDINVAGAGNDHANVANVALRFGRLRLANAIGDQTRPLSLPLSAQYWNSSSGSFDTNTLDNCTTLPASAVSFGKLRGSLVQADLGLTATSVGLSTAWARSSSGPPPVAAGAPWTWPSAWAARQRMPLCLQTWAPGHPGHHRCGPGPFARRLVRQHLQQSTPARASFGPPRCRQHGLHAGEPPMMALKHAEAPTERLAYSLSPGGLAWAVADTHHGSPTLLRFACSAYPPATMRPESATCVPWACLSVGAIGVMPLTDYQMLQIEAPAVPRRNSRALPAGESRTWWPAMWTS
jgi:hypothetical protein